MQRKIYLLFTIRYVRYVIVLLSNMQLIRILCINVFFIFALVLIRDVLICHFRWVMVPVCSFILSELCVFPWGFTTSVLQTVFETYVHATVKLQLAKGMVCSCSPVYRDDIFCSFFSAGEKGSCLYLCCGVKKVWNSRGFLLIY